VDDVYFWTAHTVLSKLMKALLDVVARLRPLRLRKRAASVTTRPSTSKDRDRSHGNEALHKFRRICGRLVVLRAVWDIRPSPIDCSGSSAPSKMKALIPSYILVSLCHLHIGESTAKPAQATRETDSYMLLGNFHIMRAISSVESRRAKYLHQRHGQMKILP